MRLSKILGVTDQGNKSFFFLLAVGFAVYFGSIAGCENLATDGRTGEFIGVWADEQGRAVAGPVDSAPPGAAIHAPLTEGQFDAWIESGVEDPGYVVFESFVQSELLANALKFAPEVAGVPTDDLLWFVMGVLGLRGTQAAGTAVKKL